MKISHTIAGFIWFFVRKQFLAFAYIVLCSAIWAINESLYPYFIKSIVDILHNYDGNPASVWHALKIPLCFLGGLWFSMELSMRTQGLVFMKTFPKLRQQIRDTIFGYVRQHSHDYFANNFAGNIASKINDLPSSTETILQILLFNFISFSIAFIVALVMIGGASPIFSVLLLSWSLLHLALSWLFLKKGHRLAILHSESASTVTGKIVDSLSNIFNVQLFSAGIFESDYVGKFSHQEQMNYTNALRHLEKMKFFQGLLSLIFILSIILTLIHGWIHSWVTLGDFTLVGMLCFSMLGFIWYASYQMTTFVREAGTMRAALGLVSVPHQIVDFSQAYPLHNVKGLIEFKQVHFAYQTNKAVFSDLNVVIPVGQKVGLVGFSGSGKSTFVNLILRFYDIQSGAILIDQHNIADVTGDSLRSNIAMIPQDPTLFHRSLMENIRYGRMNATDEEVIEASRLAHCHGFINELDEKYDSLVGERGIKLSGGQRQRIAIARAILKNAPILVLDEATSSLDSVTEKIIQTSLDNLMRNRTTIVIAHRLSTLAHMDRILVFEEGKIVEDGNIPDLLKNNGHFAKLWNMQADGFLPE